jgi:hypothetical protein
MQVNKRGRNKFLSVTGVAGRQAELFLIGGRVRVAVGSNYTVKDGPYTKTEIDHPLDEVKMVRIGDTLHISDQYVVSRTNLNATFYYTHIGNVIVRFQVVEGYCVAIKTQCVSLRGFFNALYSKIEAACNPHTSR